MSEAGESLTELFYESLGFHVEDDLGGDLLKYLEGLCAPLQPTYNLVRPREGMTGWAILLDPDLCPAWALPFSAIVVGVEITPEMDETQIRNEIREPTGWKRGQPGSIQIAVRRTLDRDVAEPLVIIRPNTPEDGRHYVRTLLSQTPEPERTRRVVRSKLPWWQRLDYEAISGLTYADLEASKYETYAELEASPISSYRALEEALPGEL